MPWVCSRTWTSANIMTTNSPTPSSFPAASLPGVDGSAPGAALPSIEQLARMANEMFSALPGGMVNIPSLTSVAAPQSAAPQAGKSPSGVPQLVDSLPPAAPMALPGSTSSATLGAVPRLPTPTPSAPLPYAATAVTPPFYFLEEAKKTQVVPSAAAPLKVGEFKPELE